jgi:hypothetical protein
MQSVSTLLTVDPVHLGTQPISSDDSRQALTSFIKSSISLIWIKLSIALLASLNINTT